MFDDNWLKLAASESGYTPPAATQEEAPQLHAWLYGIFDAYVMLSRGRQAGFGAVQSLTLQDILAVTRDPEIIDLLQSMESEFMKIMLSGENK